MQDERAASAIERENSVLLQWNELDGEKAAHEILPCCASRRWAADLASSRPFQNAADLLIRSDQIWLQLDVGDWEEAFSSHPRIGEQSVPAAGWGRSARWSSQEQSGIASAGTDLQQRLRDGNKAYEQRFGRTYIVCATGKSAQEMLAILERRLQNNDEHELREAVEQQRQITEIRLRKWLRL